MADAFNASSTKKQIIMLTIVLTDPNTVAKSTTADWIARSFVPVDS